MQPVDAVLDANVLIPAPLRDTLLRAGDAGFYRVRWTEDILREVARNLVSKWHLPVPQVRWLLDAMREAFPEAVITEYEDLIGSMPNHPKDRHVLAAAVKISPSVIVTHNLRDFPQQVLSPLGVEARSPDDFLTQLYIANPDGIAQILVEQARDLRNPPKSASDIVDMLAAHAPEFVKLARSKLPNSIRSDQAERQDGPES